MVARVLIIGGYGNFGAHIAQALAREKNIQLIIGGRNPEKAKAFVKTLSGAFNAPECCELDVKKELHKGLAKARPDIVIHTSGPFQHQTYAVAAQCIKSGCHYIDLADGRAFVSGITQLDQSAKAKRVMVVSGASSVPCLTAAVIEHWPIQTTDSVGLRNCHGATHEPRPGDHIGCSQLCRKAVQDAD